MPIFHYFTSTVDGLVNKNKTVSATSIGFKVGAFGDNAFSIGVPLTL